MGFSMSWGPTDGVDVEGRTPQRILWEAKGTPKNSAKLQNHGGVDGPAVIEAFALNQPLQSKTMP